MSNPYIGEVRMVGFNFAPAGWATCEGQLLQISQNDALFNLIGTTYGGDGQSTFALPNLEGRLAIGQGQGAGLSNYVQGQFAGSESRSILTSNMPAHNHAVTGNISVATKVSTINRLANQPLPNGHILALSEANTTPPAVVKAYSDQASDGGALGGVSSAVTSTLGTGLTGNGLPISILQPYLVMNYVIALQGIFPSRS